MPLNQEQSEDPPFRIVDPTSELLAEVADIESKIPWAALGIALLCVLWLPILLTISDLPLRADEISWTEEARTPWEPGAEGTAFARTLSRATWEWAGIEIDGAEVTPRDRAGMRLPSMAAGLAALLIFFFLGRLIVGDAAAMLAASLLAIAGPWRAAGSSALPLIAGEMLVLFGVAWAVTLQSRHREVEVAGVTAIRIGVAGIFLGIGLLLAPAAFATFLTTLIVWFLLGLRRASSDSTTLPVDSPGEITFFATMGAIVLAGATVLAAWSAEVLVGGGNGSFPTLFPALDGWESSRPELWVDLWTQYLAPTRMHGYLVAAAVPVILLIRWIEWSGGRPWQGAGLLPWGFLGTWLVLCWRHPEAVRGFSLPITLPPLLVLGFGWVVLRGLTPGRSRRQEYSFLLTWFLVTVLLVPFAAAGHPRSAFSAATITLLPATLLIAGRGARALWEAENNMFARAAILLIAYVPVLVFAVAGAAQLAGASVLAGIAEHAESLVLPVLLGAVALGILTELAGVRPEMRALREERRRARGRRGGRRRGARGGSRTGGRSGGRGSGGRRGSGRSRSGRGGSSQSGDGRNGGGGRSGGGRGGRGGRGRGGGRRRPSSHGPGSR